MFTSIEILLVATIVVGALASLAWFPASWKELERRGASAPMASDDDLRPHPRLCRPR